MDRRNNTYLKGRKLVAFVRKFLKRQLEVTELKLELAQKNVEKIQMENEQNSLILSQNAQPDELYEDEFGSFYADDIESVERCKGCHQCENSNRKCLTVVVKK